MAQSVSETKYPKGSTRDSWNTSWDRYDYRDKWTDIWKSDHDGNRWIHGWNEHCHDDNWTDAWRKRNPGDEWCSSHWETSGWNETDKGSDDREGQQWSNHSVFETMNVDQLINSLCRGDDDAATFTGIEDDPGESLADTAAQSGVIDLRPFRKAEEALFHKLGLKLRVISWRQPNSGHWRQSQGVGKGRDAIWHGRRQWHSEVYRG